MGGYDDMGKSPTFYTMTPSDGAYADAGSVVAQLYDQRFSNSIWLGKTTGYFEARVDADESMAHAHFSPVGGTTIDINIKPQSGDVYHFSRAHFGAGANSSTDEVTVAGDGVASGAFPWAATHGIAGDDASNIITGTILVQSTQEGALRHAFLYSSATSRQTSDYFAVGSTVEVLPSTWDDGAPQTTITASSTTSYNSNNLYRKFKVTGHVTNQFNTEFAKLDSFPAAEANSQPVETGLGTDKIQLEVAMLLKRRKVRSRAMNVPIVAHAMEKVDCAPATRDTLENRARPKPSWSKEGHSFIAWTAKFIMWFWQHMLQPKKHYFMPHWQTGEVCPLLYNHKYHQKAFVFF